MADDDPYASIATPVAPDPYAEIATPIPEQGIRDRIEAAINDPSNVPDTGWRGQIEKFGQGAAQGLTQPFLHPLKTLGAMAEATPAGSLYDLATGRPDASQQMGKSMAGEIINDPSQAAGQLAGGFAAAHVLPAAVGAAGAGARTAGAVGSAIRDAAIGDPNAAALRGLRVPVGSKQALPVLQAVDQARPYLQGAQSLEDLQAAVPAAKKAIIQPYDQAIQAIGSKVVQGPDGPTTIKALDNERAMLSANLRTLKAGGPEAIQLATQKGMNQADLLGRQRAVENYLYPQLQNAGIDPQTIMQRYGAVSRVGSRVAGKTTLNEPDQHYGLGRMTNLSIKQPFQAPGEILGGARDLVAGRPIWSGKPSDIGIREAFRKAGPAPNLGTVNPALQGAPSSPQLIPPARPQLQAPQSPQTVTTMFGGQSRVGRAPVTPLMPAGPAPLQLGSGEGNPEFVTPSTSYPPLNQATAQTSVNAGTPRPLQEEITDRTINVSPQGQAAIQRPALPPPETHAFDAQKWQAAHPSGNVAGAVSRARKSGYKIVNEPAAPAMSPKKTSDAPHPLEAPHDASHYLENPQALLDMLEDKGASSYSSDGNAVGLRGLSKGDVGKPLRPSRVWEDGVPTSRKLGGTSAAALTGDFTASDPPLSAVKDAINRAKSYGDGDHLAIVQGGLAKDEDFNDPGESVISKPRVLAYIRR